MRHVADQTAVDDVLEPVENDDSSLARKTTKVATSPAGWPAPSAGHDVVGQVLVIGVRMNPG